jgi:hypothetical protein
VANAGPDLSQTADGPVVLDGHGSYDPEGDPLTYAWFFDHTPTGSGPTLLRNHSADAVLTQFTPDVVGTYVVGLTVSDGRSTSPADFAVITVTDPLSVPIANAGRDQTVTIARTTVTLDGSASYDPLGRPLTYTWSLLEVPSASSLSTSSLTDADTASASFAPDVKGVYVANLIVNNGYLNSLPDATVVTALVPGGPPTAYAGEDQIVEDCTQLILDCSGSVDPDGDPLQYAWTLQSKPALSNASAASFADANAARTTFWMDVAGVYTFSCSVNDGDGWVTPDLMSATARERDMNNPPSVEAGVPRDDLDAGTAVCETDAYGYDCEACDGLTIPLGHTAVVVDLDDDPYGVYWTVIDGTATIADPTVLVTTASLTGATPTGPGECTDTAYTFQLSATDCTGATVVDTVTYTVQCCGTKEKAKTRPTAPTGGMPEAPSDKPAATPIPSLGAKK